MEHSLIASMLTMGRAGQKPISVLMGRGPNHLRDTVNVPVKFTIPKLIKRNIALFALSQSFTGAGTQFLYGLTPLMVVSLSGSAALAGLSVGLTGVSRFLVAYPVGKITDTFGRK